MPPVFVYGIFIDKSPYKYYNSICKDFIIGGVFMNKWEKYIKAVTSETCRTDYLYDEWNKLHGINRYISIIVYMLAYSDISTQRELSLCYNMPKQTVNNVINQLKDEGYITLARDENDRRSKHIVLTDEGKNTLTRSLSRLLNLKRAFLKKWARNE